MVCYDLEEKMIVILIILIICTVFSNIMLLFFFREYRLCRLELDLLKRTAEWSMYEERKKTDFW